MTPHDLLVQAADIIAQRGEGYGGIENNFQLAADLASLRLGRDIHPYEVAIMLACVKNARAFNSPAHLDSHVDAVNYELFAATFADDYAASHVGRPEAVYKRKEDLKQSSYKQLSKAARSAKLPVVDDELSKLAVAGE